MLEYCSIETRRETAPDHPPKRITEPAILTTGATGADGGQGLAGELVSYATRGSEFVAVGG